MKIGVVADTHAPRFALPAAVLDAFSSVDLIIHAGDLCSTSVMDKLARLAPIVAVQGNQDDAVLMSRLHERRELVLEGRKVLVVHGHQGRTALVTAQTEGRANDSLDCVIFGHSHQAYNQRLGMTLLFNPGSPTWKRPPSFRASIGFLSIDEAGVEGEIQEI